MWLRLLPYIIAAGSILGGYWYVTSLRASNEALRADLGAANDFLRKAQAHIRQRIDAERQQRATDAESARLAQMARDRVPATVVRLREFVAVPVPTTAAGDTDRTGDCKPSESVETVDRGRLAAVEQACAEVDADRDVLSAGIRRLAAELDRLRETAGR